VGGDRAADGRGAEGYQTGQTEGPKREEELLVHLCFLHPFVCDLLLDCDAARTGCAWPLLMHLPWSRAALDGSARCR
jgi:hypothetical protein